MKWPCCTLIAVGVVVGLTSLAGCGGHPPIPKRGVVEHDLGEWHFRRFQPVKDVEVWVEGNAAEGYTASYVRDQAEKTGHIEDADLVNVFVTRFTADKGVLREMVKFARRLAADSGYQVDEGKVGGVRAVTITGNGEAWVMWPSKLHVIKVGGHNREDVPGNIVAKYGDRYPSVLPNGVLEGPLPGEEPVQTKPGEDEPYDPNNPRPDWDKYDKDKADEKIKDAGKKQDDDEGEDDK